MFFLRLVRSIEFATVHWLTSRFVIESWKRGLWSAKIQDSTTVSNTGTYFNRYLLRLSNLLHRSSSLGNQPSRYPFYSKGSCVTFLHNRNGSKHGWRSARERNLVSHLLALNIRFEGWRKGGDVASLIPSLDWSSRVLWERLTQRFSPWRRPCVMGQIELLYGIWFVGLWFWPGILWLGI